MNEPAFRWVTVILTCIGLVLAVLQVVPLLKGPVAVPPAVAALPTPEPLPTFYEGRIGELDQHRMCMFIQQHGDSLLGVYWYCKWAPHAEKFEVRGRLHGDTLVVQARIIGWDAWETFRAHRLSDGTFEGVWVAHDKCKRLPFRIVPSKKDMLEPMDHTRA